MQRGYKRKRRRSSRRAFTLFAAALIIMSLALLWVWKSNQVKDYYAKMKLLETERTNLIAENMRLQASLQDLKSLSAINKVVTSRFGLTQNVSQRIFLSDPVAKNREPSKLELVGDEKDLPDWIDNAVFGSGRVRAESEKDGK
jgi:hypothetical protein